MLKQLLNRGLFIKRLETLTDNAMLNYVEANNDNRINICIKTSVSSWDMAHRWGDFHFALSLRKALLKKGYNVTILLSKDKIPSTANVVIVLRGLKSDYERSNNKLFIIWNISHPQDVDLQEYNSFDHVFVASNSYANELKKKLKVDVGVLLQCTDPTIFQPVKTNLNFDAVFVGNSRHEYRCAVRMAIEAKIKLSVFGYGWDTFISDKYIASDFVENKNLCRIYSGARVVLNDHWVDMKKKGFISNRIFDSLACNATVLSDYMEEIKDLFGDKVLMFRNSQDFKNKIQYKFGDHEPKQNQKSRGFILKSHTFDHRSIEIDRIIQLKI